MEVFRPTLPAKAGYVEVLDVDGNHIYKATPQKQAELDKDALIADLEAENKRLTAKAKANTEQLSFLEDCLLEMADEVYA